MLSTVASDAGRWRLRVRLAEFPAAATPPSRNAGRLATPRAWTRYRLRRPERACESASTATDGCTHERGHAARGTVGFRHLRDEQQRVRWAAHASPLGVAGLASQP